MFILIFVIIFFLSIKTPFNFQVLRSKLFQRVKSICYWFVLSSVYMDCNLIITVGPQATTNCQPIINSSLYFFKFEKKFTAGCICLPNCSPPLKRYFLLFFILFQFFIMLREKLRLFDSVICDISCFLKYLSQTL